MRHPLERALSIEVPAAGLVVSARWRDAAPARALCVLAPGAGSGIDHPSMAAAADQLARAGVSSLRYHFPYRERGHGRPDPPALLHATVRAAAGHARALGGSLPLLLGGRSMGGRMSSQAQAERAEPAVVGMVFFAFPLHPPQRPGIERATHLARVEVPMLFLSGDRDELADLPLLSGVCARLERATLHVVAGGDHSFGVLVRSGRSAVEVDAEITAALARFVDALLGPTV